MSGLLLEGRDFCTAQGSARAAVGSLCFGASTVLWSRSRQRPRVGRRAQDSLKKTQLQRRHTQAVGARGAGDRAAPQGNLGGEDSEWRLLLTLSQRRPEAAAGGASS